VLNPDDVLLDPATAALADVAVLADLGQLEQAQVWTTTRDIVIPDQVRLGRLVLAGRGAQVWAARVTDLRLECGRTAVLLDPLPRPHGPVPADSRSVTHLAEHLAGIRQVAASAVYDLVAVLPPSGRVLLDRPAWRALLVAARVPQVRGLGQVPDDVAGQGRLDQDWGYGADR
jgi:hypothetical protein